jgi:hypothetical protein
VVKRIAALCLLSRATANTQHVLHKPVATTPFRHVQPLSFTGPGNLPQRLTVCAILGNLIYPNVAGFE